MNVTVSNRVKCYCGFQVVPQGCSWIFFRFGHFIYNVQYFISDRKYSR